MWLLASLLVLPLVSAAGPLEFIGGIWSKILMVGGLSFLQGFGLVAFTRILIWILVFALFFAVMTGLGAGREGAEGTSTASFKFFGRRQAMIVAAVLATISAIFLPAAAILAVGAGWATAVGLILIGAPIIGLGWVLWNIPGEKDGKSLETKGTVLLKLLISMLLFWILSAMNFSLQYEKGLYIGQASVAGTMANFIAWALYIASIMIIYYIVKFFLVGGNDEEAEKRWQEGGEALRKSISKKIGAQKVKEEMTRRAQRISEPHSYLVEAVEDCEKLHNSLNSNARTPEERKNVANKAGKHLKSLKKNLKKAVRSLRYLRRKEKGEIYESFNNAYSHAGVALTKAKNISLPNPNSENWSGELREIRDQVKGREGIQGVCGTIIKYFNNFVEHQQAKLSQLEASQRAGQQAEKKEEEQAVARELAGRKLEGQKLEGRDLSRTQEQARRKVLKSRPTAVYRKRK